MGENKIMDQTIIPMDNNFATRLPFNKSKNQCVLYVNGEI
jgi:hypothetical protein